MRKLHPSMSRDFEVNVPELHVERMTVSEEEIDIDVSQDPRRIFGHRSGPFYVKGTQLTVHVP